jgi:hypothetical protein
MRVFAMRQARWWLVCTVVLCTVVISPLARLIFHQLHVRVAG